MSPEQAVGAPVDRRTDIFALGTTLWELACDRRLFRYADDVETLERVHAAEVPDPTRLVDGFPPQLWNVLRRALARDRDARYRTAAELQRDLDAFARAVGTGVDAKVVADAMGQLFAEDRARQQAWITEASGPGPGRALGPLKSRSSFWAAADDVVSVPATAPPLPAPPHVQIPRAPAVAAAARSRALPVAAAIAIVVVLAAVVIAALALR
jgi:serine/threonine-protein kinase